MKIVKKIALQLFMASLVLLCISGYGSAQVSAAINPEMKLSIISNLIFLKNLR